MIAKPDSGTAEGRLGEWLWAEDWAVDMDCADVIRALAPHVTGLRGVCASWDSGDLHPAAAGLDGWQQHGVHAVSPVIDAAMAQVWPESSCGFDEWYFFDKLPPFEAVHALCNWGGVSVGEASDLREVPSGFDLQDQLDRLQPRVVVGDGRRVFLITRDEALVAEFSSECRRRRTKG